MLNVRTGVDLGLIGELWRRSELGDAVELAAEFLLQIAYQALHGIGFAVVAAVLRSIAVACVIVLRMLMLMMTGGLWLVVLLVLMRMLR